MNQHPTASGTRGKTFAVAPMMECTVIKNTIDFPQEFRVKTGVVQFWCSLVSRATGLPLAILQT